MTDLTLKHRWLTVARVMAVLVVMITGCGSSDDVSQVTEPCVISGVAAKGPVTGGTVFAYPVVDGTVATEYIASVVTGDDGSWSIDLGDYSGDVMLKIEGGHYRDEASGLQVDLTTPLRVIVTGAESGNELTDIAITPLTEIATRLAGLGNFTDQSITLANQALSNLLGGSGSIVTTIPADVTTMVSSDTSSGALNYGLLLAAISQMDTDGTGDLNDIISALVTDFSDGQLQATGTELSEALARFIEDNENNGSGVTANPEEIDSALTEPVTIGDIAPDDVDSDNDGYTDNQGDCDDSSAEIYPGYATWYQDSDDDGYSNGSTDTVSCTRPEGYKLEDELTSISGDCVDSVRTIHAGASDIPGDGIDQDCDGADSPVIIDDQYQIDGGYIQYRTVETGSNFYLGWLGLKENGDPIEEEDISRITLNTSAGIAIPISLYFYTDSYFIASWNDDTGAFDYHGLRTDSAFSIQMADGATLDSGTYTYEVTTGDGSTLTLDRNFPGEIVMPYVEASSINYEWLEEGSLNVTWINPVGDYDQLRLVLFDENGNSYLLFVELPTTADEMTIPAGWINDITARMNPQSLKLQIQTRNYTSNRNNYARGCSGMVDIPWDTDQINIDFGYLQYRSCETSDNNAIRGCLEYLNNGNPVNESDITGIVLRSGTGTTIPFTSVFYTETYISGSWNEDTSNVELGIITSSFTMFRFPGIEALEPGNYTYEVSTIDGDTLTLDQNYPGEVVLPHVEASSINTEWQADGSLRINWTNPAGSYDKIHIGLSDQFGNSILYAGLPNSAESFVIPAEWVDYISAHMNPMSVDIGIQTRRYDDTEDRANYARGYSDSVRILWGGGNADVEAITGTWTSVFTTDSGDCVETSTISFLSDGTFTTNDTEECTISSDYWFMGEGHWTIHNGLLNIMFTSLSSDDPDEDDITYEPFGVHYLLTSTGKLALVDEESVFVRETTGAGLAGSWKRHDWDDDSNGDDFCFFLNLDIEGNLSYVDSCSGTTETFTGTYQTTGDQFLMYDSESTLVEETFYKLSGDFLALPDANHLYTKDE